MCVLLTLHAVFIYPFHFILCINKIANNAVCLIIFCSTIFLVRIPHDIFFWYKFWCESCWMSKYSVFVLLSFHCFLWIGRISTCLYYFSLHFCQKPKWASISLQCVLYDRYNIVSDILIVLCKTIKQLNIEWTKCDQDLVIMFCD